MRITKAMLKSIESVAPLNVSQINLMVEAFGDKWREKVRQTNRVPQKFWIEFLELGDAKGLIENEVSRLLLVKEKRKKAKKPPKKDNDKDFYIGNEWRRLRVKVLEKYGCKCMMCGRSPKLHGVVIHVDHIKPKSLFPKLKLVESNLQILCEDCNVGKSNDYITDHRPTI